MKKTTLCYIEKDQAYLMLHRIKKKNDEHQDKWIGIGGHFEPGETPQDCVLREVKEETGLTLTSFRLRGVIDFVSDRWKREAMYLFTADGFIAEGGIAENDAAAVKVRPELTVWAAPGLTGRSKLAGLPDCDEGVLEWVDKDRLIDLKLWEGDYIFLNLLDSREEYFDLQLVYEGDKLIRAVLDGQEMELFDLCDEEGNPTGQNRERGVAHRYGTLHRGAHVWITRKNPDGSVDILLQKRCMEKDSFPGCYDISSAGHLPAGSDWKESALRELYEELGICGAEDDLEEIGWIKNENHEMFGGRPFHNREICAVYCYRRPVDEGKLVLQKSEVESVRWMNLQDCIEAVEENRIPNCLILEELRLLERVLVRGEQPAKII